MIDSNDQWDRVDGDSTGLEDKLIDSGFAPQCGGSPDPCENESVLWPTLARGVYTTSLQGANNGAVIAFNNDWQDTDQVGIEATGIPPANDKESAILATLAPGNYTAIVRGLNDATGVGLVEVYDLQ